VVVALADRIELLASGEVLARFGHGPELRANDGACDSLGRLWVGTTAIDHRVEALDRMGAVEAVERAALDVHPGQDAVVEPRAFRQPAPHVGDYL
jgi:sugar lactone lactonase YvrE